MTDYESQAERDNLVRLVGQDSALRLLWEENHCLRALLSATEARVLDTEEQLNSTERLLVKRNGEMSSLVAAIDEEREAYQHILSSRQQEIGDIRNLLDEREGTIADLRGRIERLIAQR